MPGDDYRRVIGDTDDPREARQIAMSADHEARVVKHEGSGRTREFTAREYSAADAAAAGVSRLDEWHGLMEDASSGKKPRASGSRTRTSPATRKRTTKKATTKTKAVGKRRKAA